MLIRSIPYLDLLRSKLAQPLKFAAVGLMNTIVGLGLMYTLLHALQVPYWPSTMIGNAAGAVISFLLNRRYTFRYAGFHWQQLFTYVFVISASYWIAYRMGQAASIQIMQLSLNQEDTAILIGSILYTILNYTGQKYVVFRNR